ncbi:MAG: cobyric acid synthase [Nitrospirae bacterium]|nr:cobyric acid synthase [Nitrospirota bacterium]
MSARALMIQGTGSGVGKSLIVAGLCRIFRDMGINVAPFKAQNMALNSFITGEGGEIGRAQAFQAEAARVEPSVDMNPVLLKVSGETECQVIINGKVHSNMKARDYYAFKRDAWAAVTYAYERLAKRHDLIVIEGAGSPAEINLTNDEIVNMSVARYSNAPVILVGDIEKGGVFASFYGTIGLLNDDADYIKAFIINKFRGDFSILEPGLKMISEKTGRPVIGVIPYSGDLGLHEEDGIPVERIKQFNSSERRTPIKIVVLRLRYISNFTDFDPFLYEPDVNLVYSLWGGDIENADIIIIPGSKNTVADLLFLRENGIEDSIRRAKEKGIPIIGICGGYQMLGKRILDPYGMESKYNEIKGIGFLEVETTLEKTKVTSLVEAELVHDLKLKASMPDYQDYVDSELLRGYEIHQGNTTGDTGVFRLRRLSAGDTGQVADGSINRNCWGTYIHGIFDNDRFRLGLINSVRISKGLNPVEEVIDYSGLREAALNNWAGILKESLDMKFIERMIDT